MNSLENMLPIFPLKELPKSQIAAFKTFLTLNVCRADPKCGLTLWNCSRWLQCVMIWPAIYLWLSLGGSQHTIEIAAAATAVLTAVPGMMLLSEVLTSTASRKRLPTGSTFWKHSCNSRTIDLLDIPEEGALPERKWQQRNEGVYHKTFVECRVYRFEDFVVWFPFGFALVALAPFVVFRGQKKAERMDLCLVEFKKKKYI